MVCSEGFDIGLCCFLLDSVHEFGNPVSDGFNCGREVRVSVEEVEGLVGLYSRVIVASYGRRKGIVKEVSSLWRKAHIPVEGLRWRREEI